ncbi:hypothetical protein GTW43_32765, partial [Streptomyces sp. SID5785]|uniref:hypothetical protein n=1 Tax=Streptomyces sp. SID5785 TaxID=2690309 RepID=UPI0013614FAB
MTDATDATALGGPVSAGDAAEAKGGAPADGAGPRGPLDAERLDEIEEGTDTAPWVAYARGRRHLLDGRTGRAHTALTEAAARLPGRADLAYHAAWSRLLDGRRTELTARVRPDRDRWPLICLLLDADPDLVLPSGTDERLAREAGPLAPLVRARLRMAEGRRPAGDLPGWEQLDLRGTTLPERLEALRTLLAAELGRGRERAVGQLARLPL